MKNPKLFAALAALVLFLVLGPGIVYAVEHPDAQTKYNKAGRPCDADIQKFCSKVKKGGGRVVDCLKLHQSQLSPACASQLGNQQPKGKTFKGDTQK